MAAPRGYPATIARLYAGFGIGFVLSVVGIGIVAVPVLAVATLAGAFPPVPFWTAAFAVAVTSAAWTGREFLTADSNSDTDIRDTIDAMAEHMWFTATLLAFSIVYLSLLIIGGAIASGILLSTVYAAWAPFAAFVVPIVDMALSRRLGISPASSIIVLSAIALDWLGVFDDDRPVQPRLPPFGIRLPVHSSGSVAP